MKKLVIIPGGFHPFHAGHLSLYRNAREKWPSADIFLAATADTSERPFPFRLKKALAQAAGVPASGCAVLRHVQLQHVWQQRDHACALSGTHSCYMLAQWCVSQCCRRPATTPPVVT